jgi:hypothetical protein
MRPVTLVPMFAPMTAKTAVSIGIWPAATIVMISEVVKEELWTIEVTSTAPNRANSGFCPCAMIVSSQSDCLPIPFSPDPITLIAHRKRYSATIAKNALKSGKDRLGGDRDGVGVMGSSRGAGVAGTRRVDRRHWGGKGTGIRGSSASPMCRASIRSAVWIS